MRSEDGDRLWSLVARDARGRWSFTTLSETFDTGARSDAVNRGGQIVAELSVRARRTGDQLAIMGPLSALTPGHLLVGRSGAVHGVKRPQQRREICRGLLEVPRSSPPAGAERVFDRALVRVAFSRPVRIE